MKVKDLVLITVMLAALAAFWIWHGGPRPFTAVLLAMAAFRFFIWDRL